MNREIEVNTPAPDIRLPTDGDKTFSLKELNGQNVVIYFYPKDDTSGCTKQAIGFSALIEQFAKLNTLVVGISADTVAKHDKFKAKHDLKVILASDEDHTALEDYGVWVEKSMYGRKFMGIERSTFLIGADGKIAKIWRKVRVPGHVEEVLAAVEDLAS